MSNPYLRSFMDTMNFLRKFYSKLKILERYASCIAHRIKLANPTAHLYAIMTIKHLHIE